MWILWTCLWSYCPFFNQVTSFVAVPSTSRNGNCNSIPLRTGNNHLVLLHASASASASVVDVDDITNQKSTRRSDDGGGEDSDSEIDDWDLITAERPLKVMVAGAGVGGLALAQALLNPQNQKNHKDNHVSVTVFEQTSEFKRFGGPIQLASNALQLLKLMLDPDVFAQIHSQVTVTGDKMNGIKDGIRSEWYSLFDLKTPAQRRGMPYTGVIERPDLQDIYLKSLPPGTVRNGDGVERYEKLKPLPNHNNHNHKHNHQQQLGGGGGVKVILSSGHEEVGDVLIGADGIWSAVRASMRKAPRRGNASGATYSGYTLFAGELVYASFDHGQVGYKVYIGPGQYFVITDIGKGRYQWYAFLAKPAGSAETLIKPNNSTSQYLQEVFVGWSEEIHHILRATTEEEIEQRDLYDRPPSVFQSWTDENVAILGDGIHAMMPNLGQGGCQAIEDAYVLTQELSSVTRRSQVPDKLKTYQRRRLIRSAAVQGLSRFASDIIIRGFDTPAKIVRDEISGTYTFENFNYAGIVTKMLQPILPIFFSVQFNFLYDGYKNEGGIDLAAAVGFLTLGGLIALLSAGTVAETGLGVAGVGFDALFGTEGLLDLNAIAGTYQDLF